MEEGIGVKGWREGKRRGIKRKRRKGGKNGEEEGRKYMEVGFEWG